MRQPTDRSDAWSWWREHAGSTPPEVPPEPQPGLYKLRRARTGQWVAASIDWEQPTNPETGELIGDERLVCLVDGWERDPDEVWTMLAGRPVTEAEFNRLANAPRVSDLSREVVV